MKTLSPQEFQTKYGTSVETAIPSSTTKVETPEELGFFSRITEDFKKRGEKVQESIDYNTKVGKSSCSIRFQYCRAICRRSYRYSF